MYKKSLLFVIVFSSIFMLSACQSKSAFSFKDLHVDLSEAVSLGIAPKSETQSMTTQRSVDEMILLSDVVDTQVPTELVMVNHQGVLTTVEFFNGSEEVVEVPYSLFFYEVVGEFTYLAYSRNTNELGPFLDAYLNYHQRRTSGLSFIDYLFNGLIYHAILISIHNESGKIFDYTAMVADYQKDNDYDFGVDVGSFFSTSQGFFYKTVYNYREDNESKTCTNFAIYNANEGVLDIQTQCASVAYWPLFGFSETSFFYWADKRYHTFVDGISTADRPLQDTQYSFFNVDDDRAGRLSSDGFFEIFNHQFEILESVDILEKLSVDRAQDSQPNFQVYAIKDERLYLSYNEVFIVYDIIGKSIIYRVDVFEQYGFFSQFHFVLEGHFMYIFAYQGIYVLNLNNFTIQTIYIAENIDLYSVVTHFISTGYIKVQYLDGLTKVTKIIDPVTGEYQVSTDNDLSKSSWSVKPIN